MILAMGSIAQLQAARISVTQGLRVRQDSRSRDTEARVDPALARLGPLLDCGAAG
jgi:hypothetical protein